MLTLQGYRVEKSKIDVENVKKILTVKPYIPKVFVNPQFVQKFKVYTETPTHLYVPKHFGIETYGVAPSERDVARTPDSYWTFAGTMRAAQQPVVDSFLKPEPHDGMLCLYTGGGKTVCALYIASQLKLPTMVIVHNTFLRDQWIDRVKAFLPNARIGTVQGEKCDIQDVTIAMLQTLSMKDFPSQKFKDIGLVIVDECHHIASEVFVQAVPKLTSKYMLGLSATPTRKDGLMHVAHWCLGPLLYVSDKGDMSDTKVRVEMMEYQNTDPVFNEIIYNHAGVMFSSLMINKLAECEHRTKWVAEIIEDVLEPGRQVLVLSDRVQHVKDLLAALPEAVRDQAGILSQDLKAPARAEIMSTKKILIATYAMCKEGFDCPTLNTLVMATPRPDIDQIVGRILRVEKSARKIDPLIIDIVDPQFRRQFQERNSLYKKRDYTVTQVRLSSDPLPPQQKTLVSVWED